VSRLELYGATHVGRRRPGNEDAFGVDEDLGIVVVADGMGGHPAGDVASQLAVEAFLGLWRSAETEAREGPNPPGLPSPPDGDVASEEPVERSGNSWGEWMARAVLRANDEIFAAAERDPTRRGMGTTLTGLRMRPGGGRWILGHVGDSRAYLRRDGVLRPLTRDHTRIQPAVDAGRLSREAARVHPFGNVLTRALGIEGTIEPQVEEGEARPGDLFLLCSDGLLAPLSEAELEAKLEEVRGQALDRIAEALIGEANRRGGPDNITVALLEVIADG